MVDITVTRGDLLSETARRLIEALNAELAGIYPEEGATHFRLDADEVAPGRGAFLVATVDGEPAGCGALRRLTTAGLEDAVELKRMYAVPAFRGHGVGFAILSALEREAAALGATRMVLETGPRQPGALVLYRRCGFVEVARFGEYVASPLSLCMAKRVGASPVTTRRASIDSPEAVALTDAMAAEVASLYDDDKPPSPIAPADLEPGSGVFLIADLDGRPAGCGALRPLPVPEMPATGELKRMYVTPGARRRGVAAAVLEGLLAEARAIGYTRVVLETGDRQPEAIALYARAGFEPIPRYGAPWTHPLSVFMAKDLPK